MKKYNHKKNMKRLVDAINKKTITKKHKKEEIHTIGVDDIVVYRWKCKNKNCGL